jgi:hypothetical protein
LLQVNSSIDYDRPGSWNIYTVSDHIELSAQVVNVGGRVPIFPAVALLGIVA